MTNKRASEILYYQWQSFLENNLDYGGVSEAYKKAFKALEQTKWIPCSEKSPDKNERIALLYDNGLVSGGKYLGDKTYDVDFPDQNKKTKVVAWMPIQHYKVESEDMGEVSDGYHTFNQLYYQRAVLFATIVNLNKDKAWKSFKHFDGNYCFDSNGEWFIVGVDTPKGSYTYHYSKEYWNMFDCKELECGKEWDGHTEEDVTRLLSLEREPKTGHWIKMPIGFKCSNCNELEDRTTKCCPNCGVKMIEPQERSDEE